jgi:hypothetical protein
MLVSWLFIFYRIARETGVSGTLTTTLPHVKVKPLLNTDSHWEFYSLEDPAATRLENISAASTRLGRYQFGN